LIFSSVVLINAISSQKMARIRSEREKNMMLNNLPTTDKNIIWPVGGLVDI
jgi:hypothetical protein